MHYLHCHGVQRVLSHSTTIPIITCRDASLTSAISRGIRRATGQVERLGSRPPRKPQDGRDNFSKSKSPFKHAVVREESARSGTRTYNNTHRNDSVYQSPTSDVKSAIYEDAPSARTLGRRNPSVLGVRSDRQGNDKSIQAWGRAPRSRMELQRLGQVDGRSFQQIRRDRRKLPVQENILYDAPMGVPYTVAGSEFVYGTFAVTAAMQARRRRIHKLYIWRGERSTGDEYDASIALLARSKNITVQHVAGDWEKVLMKMSGQRPHNGYVLEADPIPKLPITALRSMEGTGNDLTLDVAAQSLEDQATNRAFKASTSEAVIPRTVKTRYPLLLWLDRITDTGNIGAIIRTAYFFGADAVIVTEHGTAPFNPVTIKASAGAAEHLPILIVRKEVEFIRASQVNGWRFFAAVAPDSSSTKSKVVTSNGLSPEPEALQTAPSVLMVGNEGEGLRSFMQQAADAPVSIHGVRSSSTGIDSLNVSVAAALLMARFLAVTSPSTPVSAKTNSKNKSPADEDTLF